LRYKCCDTTLIPSETALSHTYGEKSRAALGGEILWRDLEGIDHPQTIKILIVLEILGEKVGATCHSRCSDNQGIHQESPNRS